MAPVLQTFTEALRAQRGLFFVMLSHDLAVEMLAAEDLAARRVQADCTQQLMPEAAACVRAGCDGCDGRVGRV